MTFRPGRYVHEDDVADLVTINDELLSLSKFLSERLDSFDPDYTDAAREYYGHVEPAHERLKMFLTRAEAAKGE